MLKRNGLVNESIVSWTSGGYHADGGKVVLNNIFRRRALGTVVVTMLILLLAGGAGASTPVTGCTDITSSGTYVLTGPIINSSATYCINISSSDVVLDGNGKTIDGVHGSHTYGVYVYNPTVLTNVTVRNLNVTDWVFGIYYNNTRNGTIRGNNASSNSNGIYLTSSRNNTLSGNNASDNYNGIYLYSSSNNTLSGNTASNNGDGITRGIGIRLDSSSNNTLSGNNASNNSYGIHLDYSSNNTLSSNNASNNGASNYGSGIYLNSSSNNTLSGNIANSNRVSGIDMRLSSNNTLSDNNVSNNGVIGNYGAGIFLDSSSNNTVSGNTANSNNDYGIRLYDYSSNNTVSGNTANSNRQNGVSLVSSSNNTVSGNTANSNYGSGINLYYFSNNNTVSSNSASNNGAGIGLDLSNNNTVSGNNASDNNYGIHLVDRSNYNTLSGNNASNNDYGIYLYASNYYGSSPSNYNTLNGNNASNNDYGIRLEGSKYNTLNGNNASNNVYGIYLYASSFFGSPPSNNNTLSGNTASNNDYGIRLEESNSNMLSGNNASNNNYGIYLTFSSNNNLTNNNAPNNSLWDFYSRFNSLNNIVTNLTINPMISFEGKDIAIKSASTPAADPGGYQNISKYINATNTSSNSWLFLNVSYSDGEVSGLDESTLRMWKYNGSWSQVAGTNGVDTLRNYVYMNTTSFGIFAPMADAPGAISACRTISIPGAYVLTGDIIDSSSFYCIEITSSDVVLDGNGFRIDGNNGVYTSGVYVNNPSTVLTNVTVKNLTATDWYYGIYYSKVTNGIIENNNAYSNYYYGIGLYISNNNTLSGNNAYLNNGYGIYLNSSSSNTLSGNTANSNNVNGIRLYSSSNNTLSGNNASNNNYHGIVLDYSSNNTLSGNNASNNNYNGIGLYFSSSNTLSGNNASNSNYGIYLYSSSNNTLSGNNANSNDYHGIDLWYSSNNNTLSSNNASNNSLWDFYSIYGSINITVINLTINPTISFTGKDIAIKSASSPAADPGGFHNISKYINATNTSANSWLFLNVSYSEGEVSGLDESTLRMWKYNGSWSQVAGTNGVDIVQNYVYMNTTIFSIFAPMAESPDTTPPTVTPPSNITAEATGSSGAVVNYSGESAYDLVDGAITPSCSPASDSTFPIGITTVTCTATDSTGNTGSASFTITVVDTTPLTVTPPSNITAEATSPAGAAVTYSGESAYDLVDGAITPSCSPASDSTFPIGTTTVICMATDAAGNMGSASFTITVVDTTPPTVTPPSNITTEATSPAGAIVSYSGESAYDLVDGAITPTCSPASGSTFPIGTTTVTCTATDAAGNTGSASFTITVVDTSPPTVTPPSNITAEATSPAGAAVSYSGESAYDLVDGAIMPTCSPASGSTFPIGITTVICTATDAAGNTGSASFTITVFNPFDFNLTASPQNQIVRPVGSAVFTVEVTLLSGIPMNVDLSVVIVNASNAPEPTITSSISPPAVLPTSNAILFVGTNSSTPEGIYNVTITGSYGALQKTVNVSLTVEGSPVSNNPIAGSDFAVKLVNGSPSTNQINIPTTGSFVIVLVNGSSFAVIDNDAADGLAKIQLIDNRVYKFYGKVSGGNKNADITILSPFNSGALMPQAVTLQRTSPPASVDLTSLSPFVLQIPAPASIVNTSKPWVSLYYPSSGLPYNLTNSGVQHAEFIFILQ